MRKQNWFQEIMLIILVVMMVLAIFVMFGMVARTKSDARTYETAAEAQDRIDAHKAAQAVAVEHPMIEYKPLEVPAVEPVEDWYIESIPLDKQLQKVVFEASCANGVDYFTALGLIRVESDFQADEVNPISGAYGLCQLNPEWFPSGLSPEDNIRFGMGYLGELLERYSGDMEAALRAFNRGWDDGYRGYSKAVLEAAEDIMDAAGVVTK